MILRVRPPGAGEVLGDAPDRRVELLCDDPALHVTWSRFAAGRDGADLHVHHTHTDFFYVLHGEFTLRLGLEDEQVVAPAHTLVQLPPMVVHGFRNASAADVRFLNLHAPGAGFADYMRGIRDGRPVAFDQHDPPADGAGVRPATDATITHDVPLPLGDGDGELGSALVELLDAHAPSWRG